MGFNHRDHKSRHFILHFQELQCHHTKMVNLILLHLVTLIVIIPNSIHIVLIQ